MPYSVKGPGFSVCTGDKAVCSGQEESGGGRGGPWMRRLRDCAVPDSPGREQCGLGVPESCRSVPLTRTLGPYRGRV